MSRYSLLLLLLAVPTQASAQEKVTWQDHIRPIFENRCNNCHNPDKKKGDLDLSTFAGLMAGGSGGASVEAGDSAASTLWKVVSHTSEPVMPPKGDKIPQTEIDLIAKFIAGGLLETPDGVAKVKKKASFAMKAVASAGKPEGPPPMPEHLLLEPVVTSPRANAVIALAHSPWAPLAALAAPRQVLLYHSGSGELLGVLPFPEGGTPETLSFSRNGSLLLAGGGIPGKQGVVVVWDVKTGQSVINLTMSEDFDTVLAADISADLSKIAMGGPGRRVRIYDTRTSQMLANIKKHTDWVTSIAFSPDGVLLASGDRNGGLFIWEAATGSEYQNLRGHEKMIASLAWRGDSNLVAAGSEDGNFTWWEMANGTQVKKVGSHGGVLALGFAPDGRMVSGGRDGHVRIWDGNGAQQSDWVPSGGSPVLKAVFSDDGKRVVTGAWNGEVKSWDAAQKDAPPAVLVSNPPSIEARLAALDQQAAGQRTAAEQAAAAVAEKEKAAAEREAEMSAFKTAMSGMPEREKAVAAKLQESTAALAKLSESRAGLVKTSEEAAAQLAAMPATAPAPAPAPAPVPGDGMPAGVQDALTKAAEAEAAVQQLSKSVLETKMAALKQALAECDQAIAQNKAAGDQATQELAKIREDAAAMTKQMPEKEKVLAEVKQQTEAAKAALAAARASVDGSLKAVARWQAARLLKPALQLRADAKNLKDKLDALREELAPLEANVATAPAPPQAARMEEIRTILKTLPAEADSKQKEADAAWQKYLEALPK
ncbi:MAG: repeat-containing protein [Verrucomicrobiales bacterium]|nr:repeat-containing protein [Verrucomicrobiales bacterium]